MSSTGCTTGVPTPEKRSQSSWQEHAKKVKQDQALGRRTRLLSSADITGVSGGLNTTGSSVGGSVGGLGGSVQLALNDAASISSAGTLSLSPDIDNGTRRRLTVINAANAQSSSVISINNTSPTSMMKHRSNSIIAAPLIALGCCYFVLLPLKWPSYVTLFFIIVLYYIYYIFLITSFPIPPPLIL